MIEHHTAMHAASHYGKCTEDADHEEALTSAWEPDRLVCNKCGRGRGGGFIGGSYTLPTYYIALRQS